MGSGFPPDAGEKRRIRRHDGDLPGQLHNPTMFRKNSNHIVEIMRVAYSCRWEFPRRSA